MAIHRSRSVSTPAFFLREKVVCAAIQVRRVHAPKMLDAIVPCAAAARTLRHRQPAFTALYRINDSACAISRSQRRPISIERVSYREPVLAIRHRKTPSRSRSTKRPRIRGIASLRRSTMRLFTACLPGVLVRVDQPFLPQEHSQPLRISSGRLTLSLVKR
jgi:hypothetical protein